MLDEVVCRLPQAVTRRAGAALMASGFLLIVATPLRAQTPTVTVGAGVRSAFVHNDSEDDTVDSTDRFLLDSVRLYVNGSVMSHVNFTFNTEYNGGTNAVGVLDAIARFEYSPKFNIWAGRLLPPSDRANLYGPYYAHHWSSYTDGVQDGYPTVATGRNNGAVYWGDYANGKVKVSAGALDGPTTNGSKTVIGAGRVMVEFWDPEPGYYINGTYYGDKNVLAVGVAGMVQGDDKSAYNVDFLLERKAGMGGAYTVEAEWAKYDRLGGYNGNYGTDDGGFVLGSYLFPQVVGTGKFEILGKFAKANFSEGRTTVDPDYDQKTSEVNLNYIIKDFNARVMLFYIDKRFSAVGANDKQVGVGLQLQM
jgi:hypothetical protein